MWGPLLLLALLTAVNPVRIGVTLLVLSRPRPMHNLLAYYVGTLIALLIVLLVPLTVIHATPASASFVENLANPRPNSISGYIAVGLGVLSLMVAVAIVLRSPAPPPRTQLTAQRNETQRMSNGQDAVGASTLLLDSGSPVISRLLQSQRGAATEGRFGIRRLLRHTYNAWENGAPWVAFTIGFVSALTIDVAVVVLALVVGSGAGTVTQFSAAIAYVVVMLTVEEIILVSNLIAPAKTQTWLRRLHDWALTHRRKLLAAIFAVAGVSALAQGMGVI